MDNSEVIDLELALRRAPQWGEAPGPGNYLANLTLHQSGHSDVSSGETPITLDLQKLGQLTGKEIDYIAALSAATLGVTPLRDIFIKAEDRWSESQAANSELRMCIRIDSSAPELHGIVWEMLADPRDRAGISPLVKRGRNYLFRHLYQKTGSPDRKPPIRSNLSALVAVANPTDHQLFMLDPIDVEKELALAKKALHPILVECLPNPDDPHCTLQSIENLTNSADILYLASHGRHSPESGSTIILQKDDGSHAWVRGDQFANTFRHMGRIPRLVILASCESAGNGEGDVLRAIGPLLVEAGVPAVIAMQGKITMETMRLFLSELFRSLVEDGRIDRATAKGRQKIAGRKDWWFPVLFMNLPDGLLWKRDYEVSNKAFRLHQWWEKSGYQKIPLVWKYAGEIPGNLLDDLFVDHIYTDPVESGFSEEQTDFESFPFWEQVANPDEKKLVIAYGSTGSGKTFYSRLATAHLDRPGGPRAVRVGNLVEEVPDPAHVTGIDLAYAVYKTLARVLGEPAKELGPAEIDTVLNDISQLCKKNIPGEFSSPRAYFFLDDFETLFRLDPKDAGRNQQTLKGIIDFIQTVVGRLTTECFVFRIFLPESLRNAIQAGLIPFIQHAAQEPFHDLTWRVTSCKAMIERRLETFAKEEMREGKRLLKLFSSETLNQLDDWLRARPKLTPRCAINLYDRLIQFAISKRVQPGEAVPVQIWEEFSRSKHIQNICPPDPVYPLSQPGE